MGEKLSLKTMAQRLHSSCPTLKRLNLTPAGKSLEPKMRFCVLYDIDEAREKLAKFREQSKANIAKVPLKLSERNVTSRTQEYTIGEDLAEYLVPDYREWRRMLREASKTRHRCPVCGAEEMDVPIFRTLCQECWCGLLLYFMSFLKDDDRPMCEREDPLVFALRMARNLERKGMPAFEHAARLANPDRIGINAGPKQPKVRNRRKH